MTTDEIIEGLESVKAECGKHLGEGFAWICRPIDKAIEALECQPCDEAISLKEAIREIDANPTFKCTDDKLTAIVTLLTLDHVTPERPKGEWKYHYKSDIGVCSCCGYEYYLGTYRQYSTNFCPNCGADMRGCKE